MKKLHFKTMIMAAVLFGVHNNTVLASESNPLTLNDTLTVSDQQISVFVSSEAAKAGALLSVFKWKAPIRKALREGTLDDVLSDLSATVRNYPSILEEHIPELGDTVSKLILDAFHNESLRFDNNNCTGMMIEELLNSKFSPSATSLSISSNAAKAAALLSVFKWKEPIRKTLKEGTLDDVLSDLSAIVRNYPSILEEHIPELGNTISRLILDAFHNESVRFDNDNDTGMMIEELLRAIGH